MTDRDYWMVQAMKLWGDSFVNGLARLIEVADEDNTRRIFEAWPEYVDQYAVMGETLASCRLEEKREQR